MTDTSEGAPGDVTRLLEAAVAGDSQALDRLVPLVYEDLRRVAHRQLDREGGGHTLQTTALIHEAYLKLASGGGMSATSRAHFLAIAQGSLAELHTQLLLAERLGWLSAKMLAEPYGLVEEVSRMLTVLRRGMRTPH